MLLVLWFMWLVDKILLFLAMAIMDFHAITLYIQTKQVKLIKRTRQIKLIKLIKGIKLKRIF